MSQPRDKGIPFSLMMFEGEEHGFRQSQNIKASLEGELYFYGRVMGFTPAGDLPEVEIENESAPRNQRQPMAAFIF